MELNEKIFDRLNINSFDLLEYAKYNILEAIKMYQAISINDKNELLKALSIIDAVKDKFFDDFFDDELL